jgi:glutathione peroxidase
LIYDFIHNKLGNGSVGISGYQGDVLLIVNVASRCGFTPQYKNLQKLNEKLSSKNFSILAFPCNDFFNQEPASEAAIIDFCEGVYGTTFDKFEKIKIRGANAYPLYKYLEGQFFQVIRPKGFKAFFFQLFTHILFLLKEKRLPHAGEVIWNFHKFVIGKSGQIAGHFSSDCDPLDARLVACIENEL